MYFAFSKYVILIYTLAAIVLPELQPWNIPSDSYNDYISNSHFIGKSTVLFKTFAFLNLKYYYFDCW
jgi:hypothetical protein